MSNWIRSASAAFTCGAAVMLAGCDSGTPGSTPTGATDGASTPAAPAGTPPPAAAGSTGFAPEIAGFAFQPLGQVSAADETGLADLSVDVPGCEPVALGLNLSTPDDLEAFADDEVVLQGHLEAADGSVGGTGIEVVTRTFSVEDLAAASAQAVADAAADCTGYVLTLGDGPRWEWTDVVIESMDPAGTSGAAVKVTRTLATVTDPETGESTDFGVGYIAYLYPYQGTLARVEVLDPSAAGPEFDPDLAAAEVLVQWEGYVG